MSGRLLERYGFVAVAEGTVESLREGAASQIAGYHGEGVQSVWRQRHPGLTAEQAAIQHEMRLAL
jgi:hypothetical protein